MATIYYDNRREKKVLKSLHSVLPKRIAQSNQSIPRSIGSKRMDFKTLCHKSIIDFS